MEAKASGGISVDVKGCARCGTDHNGHVFMRLTNPQDEYEWWAFCPLLREPVLVKITIPEAPKQPSPEEIQKMQGEQERVGQRPRPAPPPPPIVELPDDTPLG